MRSALAMGLTAAVACGTPVHSFDSGVDAPVAPDGGPDAPDAAGRSVSYLLEHGPAWDAACPPWEPLASVVPRELPLDATIRQLWHWTPTADPSLTEFNPGASAPSIAADGSLYVVFGVESQRLAHLGRDGTLDWSHVFPGQLWEPPTILPDGDLVVVVTSTEAFLDPTVPRPVFRLDPTGAVEAAWSLPGGRDRTLVSVGAAGRVYFVEGPTVVATCRAETVVWTLRVDDPRFWFGEAYVESDETLRVAAGYEYQVPPLRISALGEMLEMPFDLPEDPAELPAQSFRRVGDRTVGTVLLTAETSRSYLLVPDAGWRLLNDDAPTPGLNPVLDPADGVWTYSAIGTLSRYLDETLLHARGHGTECSRRETWYEDGSLLCYGDGASRIDPADGNERWRVHPTTAEGLVLPAYDVSVDRGGRLYIANDQGLFAFQTDALPPEELDGCAMPWRGCNERRDGAAARWDR